MLNLVIYSFLSFFRAKIQQIWGLDSAFCSFKHSFQHPFWLFPLWLCFISIPFLPRPKHFLILIKSFCILWSFTKQLRFCPIVQPLDSPAIIVHSLAYRFTFLPFRVFFHFKLSVFSNHLFFSNLSRFGPFLFRFTSIVWRLMLFQLYISHAIHLFMKSNFFFVLPHISRAIFQFGFSFLVDFFRPK